MSEFTRAQIIRLLEHATDVIRQSQDLRARLEAVLKRIDETGSAKESVEAREAASKTKAAK